MFIFCLTFVLILRSSRRVWDLRTWAGLIWPRIEEEAGFCEHGNENTWFSCPAGGILVSQGHEVNDETGNARDV